MTVHQIVLLTINPYMTIFIARFIAIYILGEFMRFYTVTELRADAPRIITELQETRKEVVVTKRGKPVALIRLLEEGEFQLKPQKKGGKHGKSKRSL